MELFKLLSNYLLIHGCVQRMVSVVPTWSVALIKMLYVE